MSSVNKVYARVRLALSPSGGSLVSLIEFWSSEMGSARSRAGGGSADRNNLHKSLAQAALAVSREREISCLAAGSQSDAAQGSAAS